MDSGAGTRPCIQTASADQRRRCRGLREVRLGCADFDLTQKCRQLHSKTSVLGSCPWPTQKFDSFEITTSDPLAVWALAYTARRGTCALRAVPRAGSSRSSSGRSRGCSAVPTAPLTNLRRELSRATLGQSTRTKQNWPAKGFWSSWVAASSNRPRGCCGRCLGLGKK